MTDRDSADPVARPGLLAELRRRNVIRMAGLYLVGAWLLVQVAGTVLPMFEVPAWVARALVIVLALGFVPALVFAWIYELTPEGLKRDHEVTPAESIAATTGRRMDRLLLAGMALVLVVIAADRLWPEKTASATPSSAAIDGASTDAAGANVPEAATADSDSDATTATPPEASIAVLPFVNMSTDAENGYFADGISEELLNVLARIDGLTVASRTSSFTFRDGKVPLPEIARTLGVKHVLEGSVRRQGQRVRITAQLIRAGTDAHLWSQTYDRDVTDIFAVQEEIAQAISNELAALLPVAGKVAVAQSTDDIEAYERFLRGRSRFYQRQELEAGIADLEFAVGRDPDLAEAWVFLAAARYVAPGYTTSADDFGANTETLEALKVARTLAPEHPMVMALDGVMLADGGDFIAGLDKLALAAAMRSTDTTPVLWHGLMLLQSGYIAQAMPVLERAARADPLSGINNGYLGIAHLDAGDEARGAERVKRAAELGWTAGQFVYSIELATRGDREQARKIIDSTLAVDGPEAARVSAAYSRALADPNAAAEVLALADEVAEVMIPLGQQDRLLENWHRIAAGDRQELLRTRWAVRTLWLPSTRSLREDPRFFDVARAFGLVKLWETRGWPDGCTKASAPDRLVCSEVTAKRR